MARTASFFLVLLAGARYARAQEPGTFKVIGNTPVNAMMMFVGNDEKVYILDKSENNAAKIGDHPAMGAVWDIATGQSQPMDIVSNSFCAAGFHLPNGTWATFGGNQAITPSEKEVTGIADHTGNGPAPVYGSIDGRRAVRVVKPCTGSNFGPECAWFDDPSVLSMMRRRWYATAEALGDGSIALIGGMTNGGYINRDVRWFANPESRDPVNQHTQAENNIEFFPARPGFEPRTSNFLVNAGGLNTYAHAYLLKSGKMFLQANVSTILLDTNTMEESPLPNMPNGVVRVYPASGGVAVLPLTPANNWNPTILFCGGSNAFNDEEWGTYLMPNNNPWERRASSDCQRITPEPEDGTAAAYVQDDEMPDPRTMGQFVQLPDGKLLMINGARNGTAGYSTATPTLRSPEQMPFHMSLAAEEVLTPALYDPSAAAGKRWITEGLGASTIPRMYHSTAVLLPDGSVMIAGSNPNPDVVAKSDKVPYGTEYQAEVFYPPYFNKPRPQPLGVPTQPMSYGGTYFNMSLPAGRLEGNPNDLATKTKVVLMRTGFSTHGMNMGQRYVQLHSSYTVLDDGTIVLHVSPPPPNSNILTPGPAVMHVVVDGVPSIGRHVMVGSGAVEPQTLNAPVLLPTAKFSSKYPSNGSASDTKDGGSGGKTGGGLTNGTKSGIMAGAVVLLVLLIACIFACMIARQRRKYRNRWEALPSNANGARQPLGRSGGSAPSSIVISRPIPQPQMGANPFADSASVANGGALFPAPSPSPIPAAHTSSRHGATPSSGSPRMNMFELQQQQPVGMAIPMGPSHMHTRTLSNGSHHYPQHPYAQGQQQQHEGPFSDYHQQLPEPQFDNGHYYDQAPQGHNGNNQYFDDAPARNGNGNQQYYDDRSGNNNQYFDQPPARY